MTKDFITYDLDTLEIKDKNNSGFTPGYISLGGDDDKKEEADSFLGRFKSNMSDYFDDNPNAFDFTNKSGKSTSDKVAAFTDQFKSGFSPVAEGFGIYQPPTNPMSVIPGQQGSPGLLSQIAGPVAGAAAKAFFACDMRLKYDVDCLTDMNLVKDDLADVAYFVKELQDS
jgi:hypothetical protein